MQQLRAIVRRIAPHFHETQHLDVPPPLSDEERRHHEQQGELADRWADMIRTRANQIESDVQRGLDDLRREADLMSGEAFEPPEMGR